MQRHLIAACAASLLATAAFAEGPIEMHMSGGATAIMGASASAATKMVGGAAMYPGKDIVDNAVNSRDHTTLVTAVKAAGLVDTLKSAGPFTVFAPTNNAFSMLPAGTVDTLLKPENKGTLTQVLTYHVVPGRVDAATLVQQIQAGGGKAMLKTASGGTLTAMMRGKDVVITDVKGNAAVVTIADVMQSNGVIHVVDKVLLPG
ncbi:MAG: fasciclin domain-containing protein [Comamonadaceae bacterium]|nr:MAG: fasciclin domain-containing protein [Comamonadaceae bacterium]